MTTLCKLTYDNDCTRGPTHWGDFVTHTAPGGGELCTKAWVHAYRSALLAAMMDPIHGKYLPDGHLWLAEGDVGLDDGTKVGCTRLTTLNRMEIPAVTIVQRVAFGILAAQIVETNAAWLAWADKWLSGENRTMAAASTAAHTPTPSATLAAAAAYAYAEATVAAAARAAYAAMYAYAEATVAAAARATYAARAAHTAANVAEAAYNDAAACDAAAAAGVAAAARATYAARAAHTAANVAEAAYNDAAAAAGAGAYAAGRQVQKPLLPDLTAIAEQALTYNA